MLFDEPDVVNEVRDFCLCIFSFIHLPIYFCTVKIKGMLNLFSLGIEQGCRVLSISFYEISHSQFCFRSW